MLDIRKKTCTMGKIANNLEKHGEDGDQVTGFTIPISELLLDGEELNAFCELPYLERSLFNAKRGGSGKEPALAKFEPLKLIDNFENCGITMLLTGKREVEFEGARVKDIVLEAQSGGETKVSFKLYVHPGIKRENLWLQENQNCEIKLTIADAIVATKAKDKQQDLFEGKGNEGDGEETDADRNERAAREQVAAFGRGKKNGEGEANETH